MNIADWIIVAFLVVLRDRGRHRRFFFMKPSSWRAWSWGTSWPPGSIRRLADWFAPHLKSPWVGEIAGF